MIEVLLLFGSETVLVKINGHNILFGNTSYGSQLSPIEGLKLNYKGVIREFPELENNPMWKEEAIAKFKDKIRDLKDEKKIADYVITDLRKFGYIPYKMMRTGYRPEVIKNE